MEFLYLNYDAVFRQLETAVCAKLLSRRRCYHHIEMKPHSIGRTLGIGLRVAGRVVGQRVAAGAEAAPGAQVAPASAAAADAAPAGNASRPALAAQTGSLGRGVAGFFRPFRRMGGILWLEVTGVFFLLFVVVLAPTLWRARASYAHGPDHRTFVSAAIVMAVFLYLGVSSFWRARKR